MKTIKVSEATPIQLDWLVAKCYYTDRRVELGVMGHAAFAVEIQPGSGDRYTGWMLFHPTTDWEQGGPIIERECIATYASGACSVPPKNPDYWVAEILATDWMFTQFGHTPLIAAMRCFVASKLGETVEVPKELG